MQNLRVLCLIRWIGLLETITKYLVLFGPKTYDAVFDRIRFLIGLKSGITYVDSHNHTEIKINSDDDLPLKKK